MGQLAQAEAHFDEILSRYPDNEELWQMKGASCMLQHDLPKAEECFTRALHKNKRFGLCLRQQRTPPQPPFLLVARTQNRTWFHPSSPRSDTLHPVANDLPNICCACVPRTSP
jgi:tetratricopeptide (TPR) repeat protein